MDMVHIVACVIAVVMLIVVLVLWYVLCRMSADAQGDERFK